MKVNNIINLSFRSHTNNHAVSTNSQSSLQANIQPLEEKNDKHLRTKKILPYAAGSLGLVSLIAIVILNRGRVSRVTNSPIIQPLQNIAEESIKPEYLYHMTSKENFESICADGYIKKSFFGDGVFLSDKNTIKNKYDDNTLTRMVRWYGGYMPEQGGPISPSHKVVILRVPVKAEDESMFKWRPIKLIGADNSELSNEWINFTDIGKEGFSSLWNRPVEFLYCNEMPVEKVEKIAEIDLTTLPQDNYISKFKELTNI